MIHLGDITKIRGYDAPVVDVITGGSPCQDLSVAGKRAGLEGERSGLFMEQIRIIKEMREHDRQSGRSDEYVRPRFCIWENVPGAFSSNGGKDFQAVLTEFVRIAEPEAPDVPLPDKGGWPKAGCLYDELGRWSIAWRVHDAQFWGVPQRRKRISLVADFGGLAAPEVLFERKGLRGNFAQGRTPWQGFAPNAQGSLGADDREGERGGLVCPSEPGYSEGLLGGRGLSAVAYSFDSLASNSMKSKNPYSGCRQVDVAKTLDTTDPSPSKNQGGIAIVEPVSNLLLDDQGGQQISVRTDDKSPTLRAEAHGNVPCVVESAGFKEQHLFENHSQDARYKGPLDVCPMLPASLGTGGNNQPLVVESPSVYCLQGNGIDRADTAGCNGRGWSDGACYTLNTIDRPAVAFQTYQRVTGPLMANSHPGSYTGQDAYNDMLVTTFAAGGFGKYEQGVGTLRASDGDYGGGTETLVADNIVRRLTPLECERLQGFPDNWTDIGEWTDSKGKKHKPADSPRYKALGNSIALPFWQFLARRICAQYERDITMASLFDGIGGFPLVFERCGARAVWASEIEEFPMAVTRERFKEV